MSGAVTATVVAVAAMTTAEVFTAVAVTGAVLGAVGTITGIKPLQYAGMALGAIGGIGALAVSAGVIGGSALAAGGDLAAAGGLASDGGFAGAVGADVAAGGGVAASASEQAMIDAGLQVGTQSAGISSSFVGGDIVDAASGVVTTPDVALGAAPVNAQSPDVIPSAATDAGVPNTQMAGQPMVDAGGNVVQGGDTVDGAGNLYTPPGSAASAPTAPTAPAAPGTPQPTTATADILNGGTGVTGAPAPGTNVTGIPAGLDAQGNPALTGPSTFSKIIDILGKPGVGTLASGAIQAGASFIAGATNGLTPAQIAALHAQAEYNQAAANLANQNSQTAAQQAANMRAPFPVATRTGLINQAVTGAVA